MDGNGRLVEVSAWEGDDVEVLGCDLRCIEQTGRRDERRNLADATECELTFESSP